MHVGEALFPHLSVAHLADLVDKALCAPKDVLLAATVPFVLLSCSKPALGTLGELVKIPRPYCCLVRTIQHGSAIQFARHPLKINGI